MGVVEFLPEAELRPAFQCGQLGVIQNHEHLIGGRIHKKAIALGGPVSYTHLLGGADALVFTGLEVEQARGVDQVVLCLLYTSAVCGADGMQITLQYEEA